MDEGTLLSLKRLAMQLVVQLPDNAKHRRVVLDLMDQLLREFLGKTGDGTGRRS